MCYLYCTSVQCNLKTIKNCEPQQRYCPIESFTQPQRTECPYRTTNLSICTFNKYSLLFLHETNTFLQCIRFAYCFMNIKLFQMSKKYSGDEKCILYKVAGSTKLRTGRPTPLVARGQDMGSRRVKVSVELVKDTNVYALYFYDARDPFFQKMHF